MESCGKDLGRSGMIEREGIEYTKSGEAVFVSGEEAMVYYKC